MRYLFTDGWNSFFHLFFGCLGYVHPFALIVFFLYQFIDPFEMNMMIDITECIIGFWSLYYLREHILETKYTTVSESVPLESH